MRRGHPGIGGWRNENHRHFRPRNDVLPRFRAPRMYPLLENPRFPPPGPRLHRGSRPYNVHGLNSDEQSDHHERNNYRNHSHHSNLRTSERGHHHRPKHSYPYNHPNLKPDDTSQYTHSSTPFYQDVTPDNYHINSLGDVDQRQLGNTSQIHRINPWVNPPHEQRQYYEERNPYKFVRQQEPEPQPPEINRIPSLDYTGHRPPSSDYYGSTSGAALNNNDTSFSRSVDDTVDIVRKRLMNRSDPQYVEEGSSSKQSNQQEEVGEISHQHTQQEPPAKRRIQKQRQNIKSNCDKMKSNIVHQLFKIDKDKMHKLMDDPGSSSKFEYAISSLITESQNSLNRHLRSVAEKSLVSSSSEFIHNDNNTIYEDTFMKQMQCLLDPQDSVLLEDIKPLVLAELSKVLQLNDSDLRYDTEYHNMQQPLNEDFNYPVYENYNYEDYPQDNLHDEDLRVLPNYDNYSKDISTTDYEQNNQNIKTKHEHQEPIFERRTPIKSEYDQDRRQSTDSQRHRRSTDIKLEDQFCANNETRPLFDTNTEQFSEDEDPFAELDKQYHVPVDHNFLDNISARTTPTYGLGTDQINIKQEAGNPLELSISATNAQSNTANIENIVTVAQTKQDVLQSPDFPKENSTPVNSENISDKVEYVDSKQGNAPGCRVTDKEVPRSDNLLKSKSSQSNGRKRSIDQRPSHRKEKRKKSDSVSTDNQSSYYKHDKSRDRYSDDRKSHRTTTPSSRRLTKTNRSSGGSERNYSDKYVKRKESSTKKQETHKHRNSSSSSQTISSPKDNSINSSVNPTKTDSKIKFKTIDMFMEQTKKAPAHAIRNTATVATTPKATEDNKSKQVTTPPAAVPNPSCKIVSTKHASTQVFKRAISKETQTIETKVLTSKHCQTVRLRMLSKGIQTTNVLLDKPKPKAKDAFERMKEIDLEIQNLLQEKFKLYHSLESRDACPISENLGMTVLNVTPIVNNENESIIVENVPENKNVETETDISDNMSEDAIVDDFTNIPVEELEQIALESVKEVDVGVSKTKSARLRQKSIQKVRMSSASPSTNKKGSRKETTPNISLIEQIITDDRPLEEIISLDDLEASPKPKKKAKSKPKKKTGKRCKSELIKNIIETAYKKRYNIKECSVVLVQTDVSQFLKSDVLEEHVQTDIQNVETEVSQPVVIDDETLNEFQIPLVTNFTNEDILQDSINDVHFDMLDVSEDIVIGESCEIKDKDLCENTVTISEELILDNSQSSVDDLYPTESAQMENECKTYDYSTDEELRRDSLTVTGNADAVLAIECIENGFLAACLDGNVYHFSNDGLLLNTMRGSNLAVTCLTIVKEKYGTTVYTGSLDSRIRYYELETGLEKGPECNVLSPIQTMDRAWDTVFVGTRTGFVLQFECKNNMLIPVSTVKFSEQAILALRAMKEGPRKVLLVASRSENVTVKDAQTGLLLRTLSGPKMTVYTLLFEDGKVYCGTSSHQIHVFDYASGTHTNSHEGGKGAVCLRATGGLLFAGCYDGCVYIYREGETKPLAQLRGPSLMLLSLAVIGSKIIVGYKDRSLYIWKIPLSILQEMIL